MIRSLLIFSLTNRWVVIALGVIVSGIGYWCFTQLKIEAYPDIADTNVIVVAKYNGRAAEEVEQQEEGCSIFSTAVICGTCFFPFCAY